MTRVCDCHIAHRPFEIDNSAEPISEAPSAYYHHFTGASGDMLATRKQGFAYGDLPYVSYVDPDDWLVGDPWQDMAGVLDTGRYSIVYGNSLIHSDSSDAGDLLYPEHTWTPEWHFSRPLPIHAPVMIRRDLLQRVWDEIESNPRLVESMKYRANSVIYTHLIRILPAYFIDRVGYIWNRLGNNSHLLAQPKDGLWQRDYIQSLKP